MSTAPPASAQSGGGGGESAASDWARLSEADRARYGSPTYGIAMHGAPALPEDFHALPYANPEAPRGGSLTLGERGSFDTLNPYLVRGTAPWAVRQHMVETLLARSLDEPFSLYGLLAERVATPEDRSSVTFFLNPAARFSDGAPVTVDDVVWSLENLRDLGRPYFNATYGQVARIERVGARGVRFHFAAPNRELPLLLGLMPIFSRASFEGRPFDQGALDTLVLSGPYILDRLEMGRSITLRRNPDYWGAELSVNQGRHNFETIQVVFYRDDTARWEAFTAGSIDVWRETDPARWADGYGFPRAQNGDVVRTELRHGRPSGMRGLVFNTRRALFADRRVREALALAFDYEWVNERFFAGQMTRIQSFFSGSALGFRDEIDPAAAALLAPFAGRLAEGLLESAWRPPVGAGDGRNRGNLRRAGRLLDEAGWTVVDGRRVDAAGAPFAFEVLLTASSNERIAAALSANLERLGVAVSVRVVDPAQYVERITDYDYDMIIREWGLSLSPGEEQRFYWSASGRETPGTRNYMGVAEPAVDAMIDAMLAARDREAFASAVRALDRVLSHGIYVLPLGRPQTDRIAHVAEIQGPEGATLYGLWPGVWPEVWWRAPR